MIQKHKKEQLENIMKKENGYIKNEISKTCKKKKQTNKQTKNKLKYKAKQVKKENN